MWREGKLARLHEELELLNLFDRVHDYGAEDPNRPDNQAYLCRQERRTEILAEIAKLGVRKAWFQGLPGVSIAFVLCATVYVTFHYLFK